MPVEFQSSETKENLMRAFAGECQARMRYTLAAEEAKKQNLQVVEKVFKYTAAQEAEHAEAFYKFLEPVAKSTLHIDGGYPVDISKSIPELLRMAQHNEMEEHDDVYKTFSEKAKEEGFTKISAAFKMIAEIEKVHGERFGKLADLMEKNQLYVSEVQTTWICLNCGYIHEGTSAPANCPVCNVDQGYFIRFELSPYEPIGKVGSGN